MTIVLHRHAEGIRELRKHTFKRAMKEEAESYRLAGGYDQLFEWMKRVMQMKQNTHQQR